MAERLVADVFTALDEQTRLGDALVLAGTTRTDMHAHRPLPDSSDLALAITVVARAQQAPFGARRQTANQVRSLLRGYCPVARDAFLRKQGSLLRPEARAVLARGADADRSRRQRVFSVRGR